MPLSEVLSEHIRAAFSGLYLQTYEPEEALREVGDLCRRERWTLATWDIDRGLSLAGAEAEAANSMTDPLAALRSLSSLATADSTALLVLKNFQRFLGSAEIVQALQHQLALGKSLRTFVVILAPVVQLPIELERLFVVLHHELPHREQLAALARAVATEADELPTGPEFDQLLDAAVGLTRCEAENAFAGRSETDPQSRSGERRRGPRCEGDHVAACAATPGPDDTHAPRSLVDVLRRSAGGRRRLPAARDVAPHYTPDGGTTAERGDTADNVTDAGSNLR